MAKKRVFFHIIFFPMSIYGVLLGCCLFLNQPISNSFVLLKEIFVDLFYSDSARNSIEHVLNSYVMKFNSAYVNANSFYYVLVTPVVFMCISVALSFGFDKILIKRVGVEKFNSISETTEMAVEIIQTLVFGIGSAIFFVAVVSKFTSSIFLKIVAGIFGLYSGISTVMMKNT
ncbi:hypothetical protein [Maridesulfovibrio sp.]|uniref:hypothetical protein n=1 Tax=Maridesulfovibrio sp. TaxID=2795000 RepID=UPI003BAC593F